MAPIRLGSCSFTAAGWLGSFYPKGTRSADFLSVYAEEFDTVELDVTWYRTPTPEMIADWYRKTPANFLFAAKVPQQVTHDKALVECDVEMRTFLAAMSGLREKLGPLLLQFPRFKPSQVHDQHEFLTLLGPFLARQPKEFRFAVEIRNRLWLDETLLAALGEHGAAYALTDHVWMPRPQNVVSRLDPLTAGYTYVRWLGDRYGIERITQVWDKTVVDRSQELDRWAEICQGIRRHGVTVFGYANNHYAGHSPATIRSLLDRIEPSLRRERPGAAQGSLFET